jgi:hypothetical protein
MNMTKDKPQLELWKEIIGSVHDIMRKRAPNIRKMIFDVLIDDEEI